MPLGDITVRSDWRQIEQRQQADLGAKRNLLQFALIAYGIAALAFAGWKEAPAWISLLQGLLSGNQFLPGADVSLTSARRYYSSEQSMQFLLATRNLDRTIYAPKITISSGDRSVEVEPRPRGESFVAEAGPFPAGTYQVKLRNNVGQPPELAQTVEVLSSSVEKRELGADPETMRQLSEISRGKVLRETDVARLPEVVRQWESARQLTHRQQTAWDKWWALTGFLGLLGAEWWLRRKGGLL